MLEFSINLKPEKKQESLFDSGNIFVSKSIAEAYASDDLLNTIITSYIEKHESGNFGQITKADSDHNRRSIKSKSGLIVSVYENSHIKDGVCVATQSGLTIVSRWGEIADDMKA